jgi:hypothetical protein
MVSEVFPPKFRDYVAYSSKKYTCQICGEAAVALRRVNITDEMEAENYHPVCRHHRHFVAIIARGGGAEYVGDQDCLAEDIWGITQTLTTNTSQRYLKVSSG